MASATPYELNTPRFLALLEKLIGESKHVQNLSLIHI